MPEKEDTLKCFSSMPAEIEEYNPVLLQPTDFAESETRDDQGRLHSFDDQPAMISSHPTGELQFSWYFHGKAFRINKPATVFITPNVNYTTLDENGNRHSYDGLPSEIIYSPLIDRIELTWVNHGKLHREADLPALIDYSKSQKNITYYINGEMHRERNFPAHIGTNRKTWCVYGSKHNPKGPAIFNLKNDETDNPHNWALYGIEMNENMFSYILKYQKKTEVPLWVATLFVLRVIDDEQLNVFRNELGKWNTEMPASWVLRVWGVTDELFNKRINEGKFSLHVRFTRSYARTDSQLENFLKIIQFDENIMVRQKVEKGFANA